VADLDAPEAKALKATEAVSAWLAERQHKS
jgi:hypothetical protein